MGRTGEAVRRVTRAGFNPVWSPDGAQLAFATENVQVTPRNWEGPSELWIVDVDTGEPQRIGETVGVQPSWSPAGTRIAFVNRATTPRQMDIWTITPGGDDPVAVTRDAAADWSPVWSRDGTYLYFASDRGGSMNLWRVSMEQESGRPTGEPEAITTPAPFLGHPSVSADGTRIAYSSLLFTQNIQKITLDPTTATVTGEPTWITSGSRQWSSPDVTRDGQRLVFYSRVQPEGNLYVMDADGTGLRQLTGDDAIDRVARWSPDGEWIVTFSNRSGQLQLWKIRPDGSDLQQLTDAEGVAITAWSPDGSRIAVTSVAGGKVYVFDPNPPAAEQTLATLTPPEPALSPFLVNDWSPGDRIAGQIGYSDQGVVTYSLQSGTYDHLTDFGQWPVWLGDSRRLLFVTGGKDFFVVDSQTREVQKIFSVTRDVLGPPRVTGDGTEAYFSRRVTEGDIWLVTLQ